MAFRAVQQYSSAIVQKRYRQSGTHVSCVDLFHRVVQQRYANVRAARVRAVRVAEEVAEHRLLRAADARMEQI